MRIIPAIDLIDGECVRLSQGDFDRITVYHGDPLAVAKAFEDAGLSWLHLVDLEGAKAGHLIHAHVLEKLATRTSLKIDFGGGIQEDEDIRIAFECGAAQVTGGSIAVRNRPAFLRWLKTYGPDKLILGADSKDRMIATHGWQEKTELDVVTFIDAYVNEGIEYVICTDIRKDGMMQGPATQLYQETLKKVPDVKLIASGGVTSMSDLEQLAELGMDGVIIGRALYEGRITLKELQRLC